MSRQRRLAVAVAGLAATAGAIAPSGAAHAESPLPGPMETTYTVVTNPAGGATLSYVPGGAVNLLRVSTPTATPAFKNINRNGTLEAWEAGANRSRCARRPWPPS